MPEFRPPSYHRLYVITPQRSFTALRLACLPNPARERTLIRLSAPNNGPCVPLSVVGGAEVTSRPHLIIMDEMVQKDTKALKGGECEERPQVDRRTGQRRLKLQSGLQTS